MKNLLLFTIITSLFACSTNQEKGKELHKEEVGSNEISGRLDIPGTLFTYTAYGKGTPFIVFTGSENIGRSLFPDNILDHVIFIHADPIMLTKEETVVLTMDSITMEIDKVRRALGLEKISVLGHSRFGTIPMEYALKYPENILYGISTGGLPYITDNYSKDTESYWNRFASEGRKALRKKNLEEWATRNKENMTESEKFLESYIANTPYLYYDSLFEKNDLLKGSKVNLNFVDHFWKIMLNRETYANFNQIKAPILIISGKYDFAAPYYFWEGIPESMPKGTFHLFEKAGHNPMVEIPDEFTKVVVAWIKDNS